MASRRGRPRNAVPDAKGDNDETVQRGIGLSLRNLEKQTRTKIVDQNAKSKVRQAARRRAITERQRHDIELRAQAKFRNSAVDIAMFDEPELTPDDFPTFLNPHTEYIFVDRPSSCRKPLAENQNHPQDPLPNSTLSDSHAVFIQESNGDGNENPAMTDEDYRMHRARSDSNHDENDDARREDYHHDDHAPISREQSPPTEEENDEEEPLVFTDEYDDVDPGREELEYHPESEPDEWPQENWNSAGNINWKSEGIEEDDLLPDLIIPGEGRDMYDNERLRERFFQFGKDCDDDDEDECMPVRINGYIATVTEDYDCGKCLEPSPSDDHHLQFPITEMQAQTELYQIIKASDIRAYFDYIARTFVRPSIRFRTCSSLCGCNGPWLLRGNAINPLHMAVITSTVQFVECMLDMHYAYHELVARKGASDCTTAIHGHYIDTLHYWSVQKSVKGGLAALDSAADYGRTDILHILVNCFMGDEILENSAAERDGRFVPKSYETFFHHTTEGVLTFLVENDKFKELSENDQFKIWEKTNEKENNQAIIVAASNGNAGFLDFLKQMNHPNLFTGDLPERGCFAGRSSEDKIECVPPPPAHILARYGHFELFDKLTDEEKRCKDAFNFSALNGMFEFSDEQIESQLKLFRNVKREDAFVFVNQIIVRQRFGLLNLVLNMVLSNAEYLTLPFENHPVYEDYGLPYYVSLPLESALSRCDSFDMFNIVIQIYYKFIKQRVTKPMITEDAYRCLESIQDKAYRISDQLRLAVILMVMPFVNNATDRFENIIRVHENKKSPDIVANYVMDKVRKTRGTFGSSGGVKIQWKKALLSAREAMLLKNGSVEDVGSVPSLATQLEMSRRMGESEPTRSILKKSPPRVKEPIDERTAFREAMQRLVVAFEKFELDTDAGGNLSGSDY